MDEVDGILGDASVATAKHEAEHRGGVAYGAVVRPPSARMRRRTATREISPIIGGFLFVRLLLVPACIALVFVALPRRLAMPRMPLAQLLLLISSGMPSAQILVVLLNKLGMGATASELSFLFIFQYTTSLLTTTALVSLALWIVYE